jgi:hypothetical protein
MTIDQMYFFF